MHYFDGVVCIFFTFEFDKAEALMFIGDFISGDVDVHDRPALGEEFPQNVLVYFGVKVTCINGGLLVSLVEGGDHI